MRASNNANAQNKVSRLGNVAKNDLALHFRVPQPYQYSALSQFDNDPDEEINDLDDHLEMLVEDSSSEDLDDEDTTKSSPKEVKVDSNEVMRAKQSS